MIQFIAEEELIEQTDIDAFETSIGATLPEAYKQQLLKYNGGGADVNLTVYFEPLEDEINFLCFLPLKYGDNELGRANRNGLEAYFPQSPTPIRHIRMGSNYTGALSMSLDEEDYGAIFHFFPDSVVPKKIANSFTEFVNGLEAYEEDPYN